MHDFQRLKLDIGGFQALLLLEYVVHAFQTVWVLSTKDHEDALTSRKKCVLYCPYNGAFTIKDYPLGGTKFDLQDALTSRKKCALYRPSVGAFTIKRLCTRWHSV